MTADCFLFCFLFVQSVVVFGSTFTFTERLACERRAFFFSHGRRRVFDFVLHDDPPNAGTDEVARVHEVPRLSRA